MAMYLCRIIGDGVTPETAFRPAVADYVENWGATDCRSDSGTTDGWMIVKTDDALPVILPSNIEPLTRQRALELGMPDGGETTERDIARGLSEHLRPSLRQPVRRVRA